ncbi:Protein M3 [Chytriomyces hyalinus]|nr:Protein M3 [Chytriomyces hyalinus]
MQITGSIVWAACNPILTLAIVLSVGIFMSRNGTVSAKDSKMLSTILINTFYPCLLFTNVILGVSSANLKSFLIMTLASAVILACGSLLGILILKLTNPPEGFRYGTVMATAMGNYGDMVLAIVVSLGNLPPFANGDAAKGVAYVAAFICFTNIFFFTIGFKYIGEDFKKLKTTELEETAIADPEQNKADLAFLIIDDTTNANAGSSSRDPQQIDVVEDERSHSVRNPRFKLSESSKFWITTIANPCNIATVLGLIVTMIPALRSLFYDPSGSSQPLSFAFKSFSLIGGGAVPIGILNVGTALGRLTPKKFAPPRVIGAIAFCRLVIMPVIGIAAVQAMAVNGVINADDKMMRFVLMLQTAVPTASSAVYITQFWHPEGDADAIASVILVQYGIALVTITFALTIMLSLLT